MRTETVFLKLKEKYRNLEEGQEIGFFKMYKEMIDLLEGRLKISNFLVAEQVVYSTTRGNIRFYHEGIEWVFPQEMFKLA